MNPGEIVVHVVKRNRCLVVRRFKLYHYPKCMNRSGELSGSILVRKGKNQQGGVSRIGGGCNCAQWSRECPPVRRPRCDVRMNGFRLSTERKSRGEEEERRRWHARCSWAAMRLLRKPGMVLKKSRMRNMRVAVVRD